MIELEAALLRVPRGVTSRIRLFAYFMLGMRQGSKNRMEGGGRVRRCAQIDMGNNNAFSQGCWLWPEDSQYDGHRIKIGDRNFFNRNVMIDACRLIQIGSDNMFGPDVYITDSNHQFGVGLAPNITPMTRGEIIIGDRCWIGAKVVILKGARLGDGCVIGAGAVVNREVAPGDVVAGVPARSIRCSADRVPSPQSTAIS